MIDDAELWCPQGRSAAYHHAPPSGNVCHSSSLCAGGDQWAPYFFDTPPPCLDRLGRSCVVTLKMGVKAINVANLQLEGLLMAVAPVNHVLVRKGIVSVEELDIALRKTEASETDQERAEGMSSSNRDAINFPIRLL